MATSSHATPRIGSTESEEQFESLEQMGPEEIRYAHPPTAPWRESVLRTMVTPTNTVNDQGTASEFPKRNMELEALRREIESLRREMRSRQQTQDQSGQNRMFYTPSIKLKEIVETIPIFDGHNISVLQFIRACKRALTMLPTPGPPDAETNLVRMIKARLQGHAYVVIEDEPLISIEDLSDALKIAFLPNHSSNYYRGELHNLYKNPNEHVLDYISRTKDLRQAVLDSEAKAMGERFASTDRTRIDSDVLECFINGLPPGLRMSLRLEGSTSLTEAYHALLRINQLTERDAERARAFNETRIPARKICATCTKPGHLAEECWHSLRNRVGAATTLANRDPNTSTAPGTEDQKICFYCKKPGHIKYDCELRNRAARNVIGNQGNSSGSLTFTSASQAAETQGRLNTVNIADNSLPCSSTAQM